MKTINLKIISVLALVGMMSAPTYAQPENQNANETEKELYVQNYQHGPLEIQYQYVGDDLKKIRFENTGNIPLTVDVLNEHYVLGQDDSVVIDPPDVRFIHVRYAPYVPSDTRVGELLPDRFSNVIIHQLPDQKNTTTSK